MISESIKTLLGDELTAQVETALQGKGKDGKDVDLVVGNDGTFVPADKYDGEKRRATSAENALKKAAATAPGPAWVPTTLPTMVVRSASLWPSHKAVLSSIYLFSSASERPV